MDCLCELHDTHVFQLLSFTGKSVCVCLFYNILLDAIKYGKLFISVQNT